MVDHIYVFGVIYLCFCVCVCLSVQIEIPKNHSKTLIPLSIGDPTVSYLFMYVFAKLFLCAAYNL